MKPRAFMYPCIYMPRASVCATLVTTLISLTALLSGCVVKEGPTEEGGTRPTAGESSAGDLVVGGDSAGERAGERAGDTAGDVAGDVAGGRPPQPLPSCDLLDLGVCPDGLERDPVTCECIEEPSCVCDDIYDPVCGVDQETYSSRCVADCAGVPIAYEGECEARGELCFEEGLTPSCESLCFTAEVCIAEYCGVEGLIGDLDTCVRDCQQEGIVDDFWSFVCTPARSCDDFVEIIIDQSLEGDDLCGQPGECVNPNPEVEYVSNSLEECEYIDFGCPPGSEYYYDECGCGCYEPNCDEECEGAPRELQCGPDGRTFPSECHAACAGAYDSRACQMGCDCPDVYAPQCGLDGITYANSCLRECQSVPLLSEGECGRDESRVCEGLTPDERRSCPEVCEAAMSCFREECSPDDLREVREACVITCQETDPSLVCEFGTCLDLGYLFSDIAGFELSCINECPGEESGADYISYEPETCALIGDFICESGRSFNNECGCGCLGVAECPPEDRARYISYEPADCARISFMCPDGSEEFNDECGCGCRF